MCISAVICPYMHIINELCVRERSVDECLMVIVHERIVRESYTIRLIIVFVCSALFVRLELFTEFGELIISDLSHDSVMNEFTDEFINY